MPIRLDVSLGDSRQRQLYEAIRQAIVSGRLGPGQRLPATRRLAEQLGVARNTVARAYDDLIGAGFVVARHGSGTYVSRALATEPALEPRSTRRRRARVPRLALSGWAERASSGPLRPEPTADLPYDFRPGTPDWDAFPRRVWWRLLGRRLRAGTALRRYGDPAGYPPLREAIARHLAASRGVVCRPDQVVVTNGTQQTIDLVARMLIEPGDRAVVEDPGYPEARQTLAAYGASICPVPVDDRGIRSEPLPPDGARLVYVTPSHQYPTGATLSLERRAALLEWARRTGSLVLEDDYDSEFRHVGQPVESLQGLDKAGLVIYLGTFSTVLFPPLRVGYVVLPEPLVEPFVRAKWLADRGTSALEQVALADFLTEGHFARHLRRMRRLMRARRDALLAALERHSAAEAGSPPAAAAGLHVMLRLPGVEEARLVAAARARGVGVYPIGPCRATPAGEPAGLLLGYGALDEARIAEGIRRLAAALSAVRT